MRKVGQIDSVSAAKRFGDFLTSEQIENQVDPLGEGQWAIWVYRDSQMDEAKAHYEAFSADPDDARFIKGQRKTLQSNRAKAALEKKLEKRRKKYEAAAAQTSTSGVGVFTAFVMILTVAVAIWTGIGMADWSETRIQPLQISTVRDSTALPEVMSGQFWRLITPAFLHFGVMHIGFNVMAFLFLGQMIERRGGTLLLIALFLVSGLGSNLAQYYLSGPNFGGLSGIDYALFGYVWMKSRFDAFSGYFLSEQTVVFALVWLVVCFTGLMGPIANIAHLAGLVIGVAWGFLAARVRR